MGGQTLDEVLSGLNRPASREDLHAMLDELLDVADVDGGLLDGLAFWGFVAAFGRGRGIADEIAGAAVRHMEAAQTLPDTPEMNPASALAAARTAQWAMLAALLRRVTAFPGDVVPSELQASWFIAIADNFVSGRGERGAGEHIDPFGLGSQRGSPEQARRRAARRLLVQAVWFHAARNGGTDHAKGTARRELLRGKVSSDTFKGWVQEVVKAARTTRDDLWTGISNAALHEVDHHPYVLTANEIENLLREAHWPR